MTSVFNYMFNNTTRTHYDSVSKTERDIQNQNEGAYKTQNFYMKYSGMKQPISFATSQPNVFYKGGHGALNGSTIDNESDLFIGQIQTNAKCKLNLQQRQYLTVPYLGKGVHKPVLESRLQQGSGLDPKKSCKAVTEKSFSFSLLKAEEWRLFLLFLNNLTGILCQFSPCLTCLIFSIVLFAG